MSVGRCPDSGIGTVCESHLIDVDVVVALRGKTGADQQICDVLHERAGDVTADRVPRAESHRWSESKPIWKSIGRRQRQGEAAGDSTETRHFTADSAQQDCEI